MSDVPTPEELSREIANVGARKAQGETTPTVVLAIAAGVFIALGAMFATSIGAGSDLGFGPTRLLMGVGFSVGLLFVVVLGSELFTGNNLMVTSLITHQIRFMAVVRNWSLVYVGNLIGALAIVLLIYYSRWWTQGDMEFGAFAVSIADAKVNLSFLEAFLRGVVANILVCLAVWTAVGARSVTDRMFAVLLPIAAFVTGGFEHSIANMYFTPMGVLTASEPAVLDATGLVVSDNLDWAGVVGNLIPVTLGNLVGGILVGLPSRAVHLREDAQVGKATKAT